MNMIMRTKILVVLLFSVSCALVAVADEQKRVVLVSMNKVLTQSIAGKALSASLQSEAKKKEAGLAVRRGEIERLRGEVGKQAALLSPSALDDKRSAIEKLERDFKRLVQDNQEEFTRKKSAGIERIVKQADEVIKQLAAKENYRFVFERDPQIVVYAADEIDVTTKVIELLDRSKMES